MAKTRTLALLWDNFGPLHQDRLRALTEVFGASRPVVGIELCGRSDTYDWRGFDDQGFEKLTLFQNKDLSALGTGELLWKLITAARKLGRGDYILCHWNVTAIFLFAIWLRLTGSKVYTMGCSKFDDKPRSARKEALKSLMFLPYQGGIASGRRSIDYFRFLGVPSEKLSGEYNTVSIERIRTLSGQDPAPGGTPFDERCFLCVARLVPKKNHAMLLEAYAHYRASTTEPARDLVLCGSGPEEQSLRGLAERLGIADYVRFTGFVQTEEVSRHLSRALALLLPSLEEQFGNVVPEAQAAGLPVILSDNAGARDLLVRSAVNGFVVEPDNPVGMSFFMRGLSENRALWEGMARAASQAAMGGDVTELCRAVANITGMPADLPQRPSLPGSEYVHGAG
ncbi:glycosyltransferase family 4 protein [uncultured Martelella sp.]|uniref:glycosyltransferase family 4 protein n=1 Tax=uncultured Martelella sp. TaxID=392331 RepID=UPI0029C92BE0|nr:glycosyltransferase family 4 protein [uncultured Martelella sp.]